MPNPFAAIQNNVFNVIKNTYGNNAEWNNGAGTFTALVLYKYATEKHGLSDQDFELERYTIEYKKGEFEGLKESVSKSKKEQIRVTTDEGVTILFNVRRVVTKYDGKTLIAYLSPVEL